MNVRIALPAEQELEDAFEFYEGRRRGLGVEMIVEYRRALDRIIEHPYGWQVYEANRRRALLHRFPYAIIYRVEDQEIIVDAFFFQGREPAHF